VIIDVDALLETLRPYLTDGTMMRLAWVVRRPCLAGSADILDLVSEVLSEGIEIGHVDGYVEGYMDGHGDAGGGLPVVI
jgi:hypothetical protein